MCVTPEVISRRIISKLNPKPFLSRDEIKKRTEQGDILVIIYSKVYLLNKWVRHHPGGSLAIKHMAGNQMCSWNNIVSVGKDATDAMITLHPEWVMEKIKSFYIGDLDPLEVVENTISKDFKELNVKLKEMGLYKPNPWFWRREVVKFTLLWTGMVYLCIYGNGNQWLYLLSALLAAQLWHQAAFVAHDGIIDFFFNIFFLAGHSGISHDRDSDSMFGIILASFFGGLSLGWWKHSHFVHHIITNDPEHDPDIQHLPFFAVTKRFTENLYSTFHKRIMHFDSVAAFFVKRQAKLYYVVLAFGRFNLYVQSWLHVLYHEQVSHRNLEIGCMVGFWLWFGYILSYLPTAWHIFGFIAVSHIVTLFLHLQITLSHFGMSTEEPEDFEETFAEKALRTSMDIDCPRWMDWFHGGLQVLFLFLLCFLVPSRASYVSTYSKT